MKMWTVWIRDQNARSLQSDLDLHCPQKLHVSSSRKERVNYCFFAVPFNLVNLSAERHYVVLYVISCGKQGTSPDVVCVYDKRKHCLIRTIHIV